MLKPLVLSVSLSPHANDVNRSGVWQLILDCFSFAEGMYAKKPSHPVNASTAILSQDRFTEILEENAETKPVASTSAIPF